MSESYSLIANVAIYGTAFALSAGYIFRSVLTIITKRKMDKIEKQYENAPMTGSFVRHGMTFCPDQIVVPEEARSAAHYKRIYKQAIS